MLNGIFNKIKNTFSPASQPEPPFNPFAEANQAKQAPLATITNVEGLYQEIIDDSDFVLEISSRTDTYKRMLRDAHVAACWASRTIPVASAPWRIISPSAEQGGELTKQLRNFPEWQRYNLALLDAIFRGWAAVEIVFNEPGGDSIVRDYVVCEQEYVSFTRGGEPRLLTQKNPVNGVDMPFPQFIVVSWGDQRHGRRRGKGVGQRVYWPWFFRVTGFKFWARAIERFGMPGLKAQIRPTGDKQARRDRFKEIMRDYVGGTGVVYEDGEKLELLDPKSPGNAYRIYNEFFGAEISKTILGQTLTTEQGSRGAYSLGKIHAAVRDDIMWSDTAWLAGIHSRYTLAALGGLLFGEKYEQARFEYIWEDPEEGIRNAKRMTELGKMKIPLRVEDVYSAIGFPKPEKSDDVFEWPDVPAPGTPQFGANPGGAPLGLPHEKAEFSEKDRLAEARRSAAEQDTLTLAGTMKAIEDFNLDRLANRLKKNGISKGSRPGPFSGQTTSRGLNGS